VTTRPSPTRRAALTAAGLAVLLGVSACGREGPDHSAFSAADRAAVDTCTEVVDLLDEAGRIVRTARRGHDVAGAVRRIGRVADRLESVADTADDHVVGQAVQEVVDSLDVYAAVLPDPELGAHPDAEADVSGRLEGFRRTCPAAVTPDGRTGAWVAGSDGTAVSARPGGRSGQPLLVLRALDGGGSVTLTDSPAWVDRTWGGTYRVAVRARTSAGSGTLTLVVRERAGGQLLGEARTSLPLTTEPSLVGVRYRPTRQGGPLDVQLSVDGLDDGATVELDGLGVARG
jgi:hypothetical protein